MVGHGDSIQEIMRQKADLVKERDALHVECNRNREKLTAADEHIIDQGCAKTVQYLTCISDSEAHR